MDFEISESVHSSFPARDGFVNNLDADHEVTQSARVCANENLHSDPAADSAIAPNWSYLLQSERC